MKFEYILLGLLALRPFSGYELGKYVEQEGRFLRSKVHLSQIYRLLARMVDSGWVHYEISENDGRPDSKTYRLSGAGEAELRAWIASPYEPPSRFQDAEFMARFLFGGALDRPALLRLVETELAARRAQVARFRHRDRHVGTLDPIDGVDRDMVRRLSDWNHGYGTRAIDQWIDWLQDVLAQLQAENAS